MDLKNKFKKRKGLLGIGTLKVEYFFRNITNDSIALYQQCLEHAAVAIYRQIINYKRNKKVNYFFSIFY